MKHQKWMKCGIGCLTAIMMLGTAFFSVQAFTGKFQPDNDTEAVPDLSLHNNAGVSPADSDSGSGSVASGSYNTANPGGKEASASHNMDGSPETKGFLAAPWIPVSFIRQSAGRDISLEQLRRIIRIYTIKSYPSDNKPDITDRNIRNMSNTGYQLQVHTMHIAKLTAG